MKILAAQLNLTIGDLDGNTQKILSALHRAKKIGVDVVLFSELTVTGYCPEDLLLSSSFIEAVYKKLEAIQPATKGLFVVVGLPRRNLAIPLMTQKLAYGLRESALKSTTAGFANAPVLIQYEGVCDRRFQGALTQPISQLLSHERYKTEKPLYNSAAVFADGQLLGFKDKTLLPTYDVFDERRFFEPGKEQPIWEYLGHRIAVTICEDIWRFSEALEPDKRQDFSDGSCVDPVLELKQKKPDLVLNLSGSPYSLDRKETRLSVFQTAVKALEAPLVFCNQVGANDELVFDGHSLYLNEKGELMQIAKGFVEEDLIVDLNTHACPCSSFKNGIQDLYAALVLGVRDYFQKQGLKKAILGLSGGIDSALVACIAKEALGAENLFALALPSRYSSKQSFSDAVSLCDRLNIELKEVGMDPLFQIYLDLLKPLFSKSLEGITEENLQPRIRSTILMAFANQNGAILLNTSNKSEMAVGYATLYGDMAGGLGVLQDVKKMQVYQLAAFINRKQEIIPKSILERVPSAELRYNQTDFDTLPPYEILDALIEDYMELNLSAEEIVQKRSFSLSMVEDLIRKIHLAEYKRRQAPIGIRVSQKAFSKGRMVPIVQKWK